MSNTTVSQSWVDEVQARVHEQSIEIKRITGKLEEAERARNKAMIERSSAQAEIDRLKAELERLTPSGQVAEDVALAARGIHALHLSPDCAGGDCDHRRAFRRLAAKAKGYEAAVAEASTLRHRVNHYDARLTEARNALRDAGVSDEDGKVPHHHVLSVAQRIGTLAKERDAALTQNRMERIAAGELARKQAESIADLEAYKRAYGEADAATAKELKRLERERRTAMAERDEWRRKAGERATFALVEVKKREAAEAERDTAVADNAALLTAHQKIRDAWLSPFMGTDDDRARAIIRIGESVLETAHPGADLLKERQAWEDILQRLVRAVLPTGQLNAEEIEALQDEAEVLLRKGAATSPTSAR